MSTVASGSVGTYAAVNGLQMYYEVHGSGRPLVLLHGGLLTIESSFAALIPELGQSHQVIAVELQGHGHTGDIDRAPTVPNLAGDVVALLDHLGIGSADLFGYSLGGLVALEAAIRHPERTGRLVLAAVHFRPDGYHDEIRFPERHPDSTRMPTQAEFDQMRADHLQVAPEPGDLDSFTAKAEAEVGAFQGWPAEVLGEVANPTLLMIGDHDFVRIEHAAEMLSRMPNAQLAVLPGTTHMTLTQNADVVIPIVSAFLAGGR
jgi:pimeloyl-ACP methyl ester carboxylesterase